MTMQRVQSIADAQALALLKATGATMVCAGTKFTGGVDTKRPALVVGVAQKRALADIPPGERVPSRVAGVATDVIELPMPQAHPRRNSLTAAGLGCDRAIERHRPLTGGISMFQARWPWALGFSGTLGAIVRDATDGALVGLSNNHCLGLAHVPGFGVPWYSENTPAQVPVIQPSGADLGNPDVDRIGAGKRILPLAFATATSLTHPNGVPSTVVPNDAAIQSFPDAPANLTDAGIVSLDAGIEAGWGMLEITPGPLPFASRSEVVLGMSIYKAGRTTGRVPPALGTIGSLSVTHTTSYGGQHDALPGWERTAGLEPYVETLTAIHTGQMFFTPATSGHVTGLPGDSGSVVLGLIGGVFKIVGLYHSGVTGSYGFFTPIWTVAELLGIEAYTDVLAPPAAGQRSFFGVACQAGASVAAATVEALPGSISPVTAPPASAPSTGDVTHAMAHRGDAQQVITELFSLSHGPDALRLGRWPEAPATRSYTFGLVFEGIAIPQGATVTSAVLECTVHPDAIHDRRGMNDSGDIVLAIRAADTDDGWRPRSFDDWTGAAVTTANVTWTIPAGPGDCPAPGAVLTSPNLATVINELLARSGWAPGNGIALRLVDGSGSNISLACVGRGDDAPRLRVVWG